METDDNFRHLVLLDMSIESPIAKLLTAGVQIYNEGVGLSGNSGSLNIDIITYADLTETNLDELREKMILSFVGEKPLSRIIPIKELRPTKRLSPVNTRQPEAKKNVELWRVPSSSLELAQGLVAQHASKRIYLVVPSDPTAFSGLDIAAALIAGFAGVIDIHSLISRESLGEIVLHQPINRWHRSMLLVGTHLVSEINRVKAFVENWKNDNTVEEKHHLACWRACIALAQLDGLMPIFGGGETFAFTKFAPALNLAEPQTLFKYTESDLRKVIGVLARWLMQQEHEQYGDQVLVNLPQFARRAGFPKAPPAISGMSDAKLMRELYHVLCDMELTEENQIGGLSSCRINTARFSYKLRSRRSTER